MKFSDQTFTGRVCTSAPLFVAWTKNVWSGLSVMELITNTELQCASAKEVITEKAPRFLLAEQALLVQNCKGIRLLFFFVFSRKTHFWGIYLSTTFKKPSSIQVVASILRTDNGVIPSIFHSVQTPLRGHRRKELTPNYPITLAITHHFPSQDLPDGWHVPGIIPLF